MQIPYMRPNKYLQRLVAAVVKESGICRETVEQVVPAVLDAIRRELVEGEWRCVPIESFGTFAVVEMPEREYHSTYKGDKIIRLPAKKKLRFRPSTNMIREIELGVYDTSRVSFKHHPKDPYLRKKSQMQYQPNKAGVFKGATRPVKESKSDE